jgi:hypothetical protein
MIKYLKGLGFVAISGDDIFLMEPVGQSRRSEQLNNSKVFIYGVPC